MPVPLLKIRLNSHKLKLQIAHLLVTEISEDVVFFRTEINNQNKSTLMTMQML